MSLTGRVKPLDFTELCYRPCSPSSSSDESCDSSCYGDITRYPGDITRYRSNLTRYDSPDSRYHSCSTVSSDFRHSWMSEDGESVTTAISDVEDEVFANIYEKSEERVYQRIPDRTHQNVPVSHNEYENIDDICNRYRNVDSSHHMYENTSRYPAVYENITRNINSVAPSLRPSQRTTPVVGRRFSRSVSIDYQRPSSVMEKPTTFLPTSLVSTSCLDLSSRSRDVIIPSCDVIIPSRDVIIPSRDSMTPLERLGYDPCARDTVNFCPPPPSYRESCENLRLMRSSLQNLATLNRKRFPGHSASSQNISQKPLRHSQSHTFLSSPMKTQMTSSTRDMRRMTEWQEVLSRSSFLPPPLPGSQESLCRIRCHDNTRDNVRDDARDDTDSLSRDRESAVGTSLASTVVSSPPSCVSSPAPKQWETTSIDSGVPLTSEDNECRTPEIVARMYHQTETVRVLREENKRLQLIEDVGPYVGTLTTGRRDKRKLLSKTSSVNSLESGGLKRSHTICASGDVGSYLRNKCTRDSYRTHSRENSESHTRHSKSTFDSGFESGLSDILDEILGGASYDTVLEEAASRKSKWQSFKGKLIEAFARSKKAEGDDISETSELKTTKWDRVQQYLKVKVARVSNQDLDMGGFEDQHWRSLEPRQFHRASRRTQSFVKWSRKR